MASVGRPLLVPGAFAQIAGRLLHRAGPGSGVGGRWLWKAITPRQLSRGQVSELLGLNFWETEAFPKKHGAYLHYSNEDLEQDAHATEKVLYR